MNENILTILLSAGTAAVINGAYQLINKFIDLKKEKISKAEKRADEFNQKKEEVYIAALGRLLAIRRGFDITKEELWMSEKEKSKVESDNLSFSVISPKLRLYSTDKILNKYRQLCQMARFAYANECGPRLFEDSKYAFDNQVTILAHEMQMDLDYRQYNKGVDLIKCPDCGREHDLISKCKCGLTYEDLQIKVTDIINEQLNNAEESNEQENQ